MLACVMHRWLPTCMQVLYAFYCDESEQGHIYQVGQLASSPTPLHPLPSSACLTSWGTRGWC
jgi:hypothetical protein